MPKGIMPLGVIHFASNKDTATPKLDNKKAQLLRRNCCVIAHVDHGKTTLVDSLIQYAGGLREEIAGDALVLDSSSEEKRRGITINASSVCLDYPSVSEKNGFVQLEIHVGNLPFDAFAKEVMEVLSKAGVHQVEWIDMHSKRGYCYASVVALNRTSFLETKFVLRGRDLTIEERKGEDARPKVSDLRLNLTDTPGHAEFVGEVFNSLRVSDGALIVVDATEGVRLQSEAVIHAAMEQKVRPVLLLNKVDRFWLELGLSAEESMEKLMNVLDEVNDIIFQAQLKHRAFHGQDWRFSFLDGTVLLGSGYLGWGLGISEMVNLSQDQSKARELVATSKGFKAVLTGCLQALRKLHLSAMNLNWDRFQTNLFSFGSMDRRFVENQFRDGSPDQKNWRLVLKVSMRRLLPIAPCILNAVCLSLPSPSVAQLVREEVFFSDSIERKEMETYEFVKTLSKLNSSAAPLFAQSVKATVISEGKNGLGTLAFITRLFSGRLKSMQDVAIFQKTGCIGGGDDDTNEITLSKWKGKIQKVLTLNGSKQVETAHNVASGDVCLVVLDKISVDALLPGPFYLCDSVIALNEDPMVGYPDVEAIVSAAISLPIGAATKDRAKAARRLAEAVKMMGWLDTAAKFSADAETGEILVKATGELHLEVIAAMLKELTQSKSDLLFSPPKVEFQETCTSTTEGARILAKSGNKLNRIWIVASKVDDALVRDIEAGLVDPNVPSTLVQYGWDANHARKVWAIGPERKSANDNAHRPTCFLVNATVGVDTILDIKHSVVQAFLQICSEGVLAGCPLHGVRFDVVDAKIHSDNAHRRPQQIVPMTLKALCGTLVSASPALLEPELQLSLKTPSRFLGDLLAILRNRNGAILGVESSATQESAAAFAHATVTMTVRESFGLAGLLNKETGGRATIAFSPVCGWRVLDSPYGSNVDPKVLELVNDLRSKANMNVDLPQVKDFADTL